jgi:hypothetical protein
VSVERYDRDRSELAVVATGEGFSVENSVGGAFDL